MESNPIETCGHYSPDEWMYLHSKCHPSDPTYCKVKGNTLVVECAVCEMMITTFLLQMEEAVDGNNPS